MTTSSASKKGLLLVLAAALLLSIGGLCVKMIPWQPLSINAFRSIISVGILLVFAKATHNRCKLTPGVLIGPWGCAGLPPCTRSPPNSPLRAMRCFCSSPRRCS